MSGTAASRPRRMAALCLAVTLAAPAARGDGPDPAAWLPADTPAYVEVSQPGALLDFWSAPDVQEIYRKAPAFAKARKDLGGLRLGLTVLAVRVGTTPGGLVEDVFGGGLAAAMTGPDRFVVVARPRDPARASKALAALLEMMRGDAQKKGRPDPAAEREHAGVRLVSFDGKAALAEVDGLVLVASSADLLEALLDARGGTAPAAGTLAAEPRFAAARAALSDGATAWAFARLGPLRTLQNKGKPPEPKPQEEAGGRLLLGRWFDAVSQGDVAAMRLDLDAERLAARLAVDVPEASRSGPLEVYRPRDGAAAPPLVAPPGTLLSVSAWRDWAAVWEVREQFLTPESLQGLAQLDSVAGQFFGGRDFATGVLGALRPDWRLVVVQQDYDAMDPAPPVRYPGAVLLVPIDPDDAEFATRLQAAFQSFVGLVNLGAAQQKAPPLMLGSETCEGVVMLTSRYVAQKPAAGEAAETPAAPADARVNFSPSAAHVGDVFLLGTSADATRTVIRSLKAPAGDAEAAAPATLRAAADAAEIARIVEVNREALISRNVLDKGNSREAASAEVDLLQKLIGLARAARLEVVDHDDRVEVTLTVDRAPAPPAEPKADGTGTNTP